MAFYRRMGLHTTDKSKSISLLDIVKLFNSAISEEQAWAICYQCCQSFKRGISSVQHRHLCNNGIDAIRFVPDGSIHIGLHDDIPSESDISTPTTHKETDNDDFSEDRLLASVGLAIFQALDYGLAGGQERHLSEDLEGLIDLMTETEKCQDDVNDEGIEEDHDLTSEKCTKESVIQVCQEHLRHVLDVGDHYQAVCRALITEVSELITFLENISESDTQDGADTSEDVCLDHYKATWARLWVQVMHQLRRSVKLKKVERCHIHMPPLEYELTPYEMLMDDIRTRRYTLNKIMVNGDIPAREQNDGHEVILAFIRSRPPLNSAKLRVLNTPPVIPKTPIEKLLDDIRSSPTLRPVTEGRPRIFETSRTSLFDDDFGTSDEESLELHAPVRRLIKPDIDLQKLLESSIEDDTDDEIGDVSDSDNNTSPPMKHRSSSPSSHKGINMSGHETSPCGTPPQCPSSPVTANSWKKAVVDDLVLGTTPNRLKRRHSITVCESPQLKVDNTRWSSRRSRKKPLNISESIPEHESENDLPTPHEYYNFGNECHENNIASPDRTREISSSRIYPERNGLIFDDITHLINNEPQTRSQCSDSSRYRSFETNDVTDGFSNDLETYGSKCEFRYRNKPTASSNKVNQSSFNHPVSPGMQNARESGAENARNTRVVYHVDSDYKHVLTTVTNRADRNERVEKIAEVSASRSTPGDDDRRADSKVAENVTFRNVNNNHVTDQSLNNDAISLDALSTETMTMSEIVHTQWKNPMECLSLTVDEVMHIRKVLTKAELDGLLSNPTLYSLVSKEKVCFTCKDTRFSFFGEWGSKCRFCQRTVCVKCLRKMNIPTERFGTIPVYTLTPERRGNKQEEDLITKHVSTGSKPPSPMASRRRSTNTVTTQTTSERPVTLHRSHTITARPSTFTLRRPQTNVCRDCKDLVCEIIRVSRVVLMLPSLDTKLEARGDVKLDLLPS